MARKTKRIRLFLKEDQLQEVSRISQSRTAPAQEIQRAKILLSYNEDPNISKLARKVGVGCNYQCVVFHLAHVSRSPVMADSLAMNIALKRDPTFAAGKRSLGYHSGSDMSRLLEKLSKRNE